MQLDMSEVAEAITAYLRGRGAIVDDPGQVRIEIVSSSRDRITIEGCTPVVVVDGVKLPEGPYR